MDYVKVGLLAMLTLLPASALAQDYGSATLRMGSFNVNNIPPTETEQWWAAEIAERSGGKINILQFYSGAAGGHGELPDLVKGGAVQLAAFVQGNFVSEFPLWSAPNSLPGVFTDISEVLPTLADLKQMPEIQAELERANVIPLWGHVLQPLHLFCNEPIRTMADFNGKLIRGFGSYQPRLWSALGSSGVTIESTEVYEGLQRARFNCAFTGVDNARSQRLYEVAKYLNLDFGPTAAWQVYMNRDVWNGLTEDARTLITEVSAEAEQRALEAQTAFAAEAMQTLIDNGVEVVEFQDGEQLKAIMPDMIDMWAADLESSGLGEQGKKVAEVWRSHIGVKP
jgi:C4-dicarboxylate-binding protein DctP